MSHFFGRVVRSAPRPGGDRVRWARRAAPRLAVGAAATVAAACGPPDTTIDISVRDAISPLPATADMGSVYLTITNRGGRPDVLEGASTTEAVAVTLHQSSIGGDGTAGMTQLSEVPIPARSSVAFQPGGLHLMLDTPSPLRVGDRFTLALDFRGAGTVRVEVRVVEPGGVG